MAFQQRAHTQVENNVLVSAAVLSAEESNAAFDLPLYKKGIQPVWLKIENNTGHRLRFAPISLDPDYFAPLEVAYMHHSSFSTSTNQKMDLYLHEQAFQGHSPIEPGGAFSGFVFTHLALGTKAFNVEVIGSDRQVRAFTFLVTVPGLEVDHNEMDWTGLYSTADQISYDTPGDLKGALEQLPYCTTDEDSKKMGDPVNVVIIGDGSDILYALLRSGWDETAARSSFDAESRLPWEFRYQPVKPLYLFERPQDTAFRISRSSLNARTQLRLWLSPNLYKGKNIWVGQISRIIRRSVWNKFIIEPDVDESRAYLLQSLWYARTILKYGYVKGARAATIAAPNKSLHDDEYFTDGLRIVLWISDTPVPQSEIHVMPWETPISERRTIMLGQQPPAAGQH